MKYSEVGFRAFYNNYIAIPKTKALEKAVSEFPDMDESNYILTYGYIDHTAGLTMEVLGAARKDGDGFSLSDTNENISSKIRVGSITEQEVFYFDDQNGRLHDRYADKVDPLKDYDVNEDVEESRNMELLDQFRSPEYPDDVLVVLLKEGNQPEGCWVRIEGLEEHQIIGTLLNEPNQDFLYHEGDQIGFFLYKLDDEKYVLCSDMNL